jgi:DNA polymerase III delta subunit
LRQAESGAPPRIALLHGADGQLLDDALEAISRSLCADPSAAIFDREVLDGRETLIEVAVQSALTLPVMAPMRLVAVRHCQALTAKGAGALADYCAHPSPTSCLVLLADESLAASRERKAHWLLDVVPAAATVALPARQGAVLESWLRRRALQEGITLTEEAGRVLVQWVGDDTAALLSEVRKAALAGGPDNRAVGVKEVTAVVGERRLSGVFDLTRAVERRDVGLALRTLEALLVTEEPMLLLSLLTREVRTAWTIREWLKRGQSVEHIARTLRRPAPVVAALAAAPGSTAGEARKLRRCWEAERRLKSGGDPSGELAALVVGLCGR